MKSYTPAPLVRLLIPLVTGIFTAVFFPSSHPFVFFLLLFLFVCIVVYTFTALSRNYRFAWVYGTVLNMLFLLLGYQLTILKTEHFFFTHYSKNLTKATVIHGRIASACVEKDRSVKAIFEWISINDNRHVSGKSLVYFKKEEQSLKLNYGDELIIKNKFHEIPLPKNPEEFNYHKFLTYKNVYHQAFLNSEDWIVCGKNSGDYILNYAIQLRNQLLQIFKKAGLQGDESAIASALLLGYTDKLDDELLNAYSETGTLHVLSVSGLHVAIVFVLFNSMLFFLDDLKYGRILKVFLLLFFLWAYAFISGLSASVLRSAMMFSFVVLAKSFNRSTSVYNTLAASAMLLLLCNPYFITDVGFQLSYLAVAGIVYIQPILNKRIKTKWWIIRQTLDLITVSIAAQLATFPLGIYYFHQFPNYFLITNLIVIPLSTAIMYAGLLLMLISPYKWLLKYISILFSKMLTWLNATVKAFSELPHAVTDFISIGLPEMILFYALILCIFRFLQNKKIYFLKYCLYFIIVLLLFQVVKLEQKRRQKKMVIYATPKATIFHFISGKQHVVLTDTTAYEATLEWLKHMKPFWSKLGLHSPAVFSSSFKTNYVYVNDKAIQFCEHRLLRVTDPDIIKIWYKQQKKCRVEYVILSSDVNVNMHELVAVCSPVCIVFDLTNRRKRLEKWKADCNTLHQSFYCMEDRGAFILE